MPQLNLLTPYKADGLDDDDNTMAGEDFYKYFERSLWFELGKTTKKNHWSVFRGNIRYVMNNKTKQCRLGILKYDVHMQKLFEISCYLYPTGKEGNEFDDTNWEAFYKHYLEE